MDNLMLQMVFTAENGRRYPVKQRQDGEWSTRRTGAGRALLPAEGESVPVARVRPWVPQIQDRVVFVSLLGGEIYRGNIIEMGGRCATVSHTLPGVRGRRNCVVPLCRLVFVQDC